MLSVPERTIEARAFIKFRCRLDSAIGTDVHRRFSGVYYPRWRAVYLDEVREIAGKVKLFTVFDLAVMYKANGDYFGPTDFHEGARLDFGRSEHSRDAAPKTYVITSVDACGVEAPAPQAEAARQRQCPKLAQRVLDQLIARSGSVPQAVKDFGKWFRQPNASGKRLMSREQVAALCRELQVNAKDTEVDQLFGKLDANDDGAVSYDEFVDFVRGPMSDERKAAVQAAFAKIDTDFDGVITLLDIQRAYNPASNSDVASGQLTTAQALNVFLAQWDSREKRAPITFAEFSDYYNGVSAMVEDDRDFVQLVKGTWN
jgi:Ca2+-binding EF-hand superfamily protein